MAKLDFHCPHCNKRTELVKEETIQGFGLIFQTYACGHTGTQPIVSLKPAETGYKLICKDCLVNLSTASDDERHKHVDHDLVEVPLSESDKYAQLMIYQQSGVDFLRNANFNAALNDEQGLGKTIQILYAVSQNKQALCPTLYVVKSKLKLNWANEMLNNGWLCDKDDLTDYPFIIMDGQMAILPGFRHYICSMSTLNTHLESLKAIGFKLIVVDESQNFVNTKSQRTKALLDLASAIPHRICASGTPILNRASEYWPTLNMIRPSEWLYFDSFLKNWVDWTRTERGGKRWTGIKASMRGLFFQKTRNYILRRNKRDVLKDLPPFRRTFEVVDVSDSPLARAYNAVAQQLDDFMNSAEYVNSNAGTRNARTLGYLMRMRHIVGVAKTPGLVEDIVEFLNNSEDSNEKLLVGVHHDDVFDQVKMALRNAGYEPVLISGGLSDEEITHRIREFEKPTNRVCLAKILAAGEGHNFQFCNNMIVFERMWNAGKEGQFEARIDRPMKCPNCRLLLKRVSEQLTCNKCGHKEQVIPKLATYKVAARTVEEVFTEMVEEKRKIAGETIDENYNFEMDPALISMLGERAARLRI